MTGENKLTNSRNYIFEVTILLVALFNVSWQLILATLSQYDHESCLQNSLSSTLSMELTSIRLASLSAYQQLEIIIKELEYFNTSQILFYSIALAPFVPFLLASFKSKKTQHKFLFFIMAVIFSAAILSFLGTPENLHDCDRKGSGAFVFPLFNLIIFLPIAITLIVIAKLVVKK